MNNGKRNPLVWLRTAMLLFASLTFVCTAFPIVTVTRWICEGRICNVSLGTDPNCCCTASSARRQDAQCVRPPQAAAPAPGDVIACANGCSCKGQTFSAGGNLAVTTAKAVAPEPLWATVPAATPVLLSPVPTAIIIAPNAARGPPVASSCPRTRSLRAPPAA